MTREQLEHRMAVEREARAGIVSRGDAYAGTFGDCPDALLIFSFFLSTGHVRPSVELVMPHPAR